MRLTIDNIMLVGSILLFISIVASKTSFRFGVPVLIFFLVVGMLAGDDGIGDIQFDDPKIAQFIGVIALNFILFSGGIETSWKATRPVAWKGLSLSTVGVLVTAVSVGFFVWWLTDFTIYEGLLLGAIVSSTDAAAVFSILRSKNIALKKEIRPLLELESGSNDPMAYFLTIAFLGLVIDQDKNLLSIVPLFLKQIAIGGLTGYLFGRFGLLIINKIRLEVEGLYPVLVIALMFLTFSTTDFIGGNGFLAIYLSAVYLGNQEFIHKKTIIKSFDGFAWLMQIVLFLTLGLLVFPTHIVPVIGIGLLISFYLILLARPLSVFISLYFFKMKNRSRWFISWVGLRGAVPIVFATFPLLAGIEKAQMIFNIVFFISVTSVLIQGTTLTAMARFLQVAIPDKAKLKSPVDIVLEESIKSELVEIVLPENCSAVGKKIVQLNFPNKALISIIERGGKYITPNGSTGLEAGDKLHVISENKQVLARVFECLDIGNEEVGKP